MTHHDQSVCGFGAEAIARRLEAMLSLATPVREGRDVEAVHDMRVASRRLRAALKLFEECLPPRTYRQCTRRVRKVTRALGAARDTDVQVEFVEGFLEQVEDRRLRPGIRRLLLRLRQQRQDLQAGVIEALEDLETHPAIRRLQGCLARLHMRGRRIEAVAADVRRHAQRTVTAQLDELLAYERDVPQVERVEQLHAMRIAAKHLRYSLEVFRPAYDGTLDDAIAASREIQRRLGEIHDCDVWVAWLPVFAEQERQRALVYFGYAGPARRLAAGIDHLRAERAAHRQACYAQFVPLWEQLRQRDVWGNLLVALAEGPACRPAAVPSPADGAQEQPA